MKKLIEIYLMLGFALATFGEDKLALNCNEFAFKFYKAALESRADKNFVFSPVSIYSTTALLEAAANGETAKELSKLLSSDVEGQTGIEGIKNFLNSIDCATNRKSCLFKSWDFVWLSNKLGYDKDFKEKMSGFPELLLVSVDFSDAEAASKKINKTIYKHTGGIVKNASIEFPPESAFAVSNFAIFDGLWEYPFDPKNTMEMNFLKDVGEGVEVQMMDSTYHGHKYHEELKFEAVRMDYKGGQTSMVILVPKGNRTLKTAITHMNAQTFDTILKDFSNARTVASVVMPRFKLDTDAFSVKEIFEELGARSLFAAKADFTRLSDGLKSIPLDRFEHKAAINVNEKETKASAETAASRPFGSPRVRFVANRPFIFFVVDNKSGLICFMGHVKDPSKN